MNPEVGHSGTFGDVGLSLDSVTCDESANHTSL